MKKAKAKEKAKEEAKEEAEEENSRFCILNSWMG